MGAAAKVISGTHYSALPRSYVRSESERPKLSEVVECNNIPIIDLSCQDSDLVIRQVGDACRDFGFFQVGFGVIFR